MAPAARKGQRPGEPPRQLDRTTFRPGDYGRMTRPDGTLQWWVRSSTGGWTTLSHQRVVENDDGTITLLYLE